MNDIIKNKEDKEYNKINNSKNNSGSSFVVKFLTKKKFHLNNFNKEDNYIKSFVNAVDKKNIKKIKYLLNNNDTSITDIVYEIYRKGFLSIKRLEFIIEKGQRTDGIIISSDLIKKLIRRKEVTLLNIIIFNMYFFDVEIIKKLLLLRKNRIKVSKQYLYKLLEKYRIIHVNENLNSKYFLAHQYGYKKYLYFALKEKNENAINFLIKHGINVNIKFKLGQTPLMFACWCGFEKVVKYLIKHGAIVNNVDVYGKTPLIYACIIANEVIAKLLVENGADVNSNDINGNTPIHYSCINENENTVKLLADHKANLNIKNNNGDNPLILACKQNNENIVKILVEHQVNINEKDSNDRTPLLHACIIENENIVNIFIKHEGDVNSRDIYGSSPLHYACEKKNENLVEILVEHDANINIKNNNNDSPLLIACKKTMKILFILY